MNMIVFSIIIGVLYGTLFRRGAISLDLFEGKIRSFLLFKVIIQIVERETDRQRKREKKRERGEINRETEHLTAQKSIEKDEK